MIVRRQTSARPCAVADGQLVKTTQTIPKRGGPMQQKKKGVFTTEVTEYQQGYNSSRQAQLLAKPYRISGTGRSTTGGGLTRPACS